MAESRDDNTSAYVPLTEPVLESPENHSIVRTARPAFQWQAPRGSVVAYRLQVVRSGVNINTGPYAINVLVDDPNQPTQYEVGFADALDNGVYLWRVLSRDAFGKEVPTLPWTFTVDAVQIEQYLITLSSIQVNKQVTGVGSPWVTIVDQPITFDLAEILGGGIPGLLGDVAAEPGIYKTIRLTVENVRFKFKGASQLVTADEFTRNIKIDKCSLPDGSEREGKCFEVFEGKTTRILLDISSGTSLLESDGDRLKFDPRLVIKVLLEGDVVPVTGQKADVTTRGESTNASFPSGVRAPGLAAPLDARALSTATGTIEVVVSDTSAAPAAPPAVSGRALLQGRGPNDHAGTKVAVFQGGVQVGNTFVTLADGAFAFVLSSGDYKLQVTHAGWLPETGAFVIETGSTADLGNIKLLAGDADSDGDVDANDLRAFQRALVDPTGSGFRADFDNDGVPSVFDLAHIGLNLGRSADSSCSTPVSGHAQGPRILSLSSSLRSDNSLVVNVDVRVDRPTKVYIEYDNPSAGRFRTKLTSALATRHSVSVMRLMSLTTYCFQVIAVDAQGLMSTGALGRFTTGALPPGLQKATFTHVKGKTTDPVTLLDHTADGFHGIVALDSHANVVWYYQDSISVEALVQDPTTYNLLFQLGATVGTKNLRIKEATPAGDTVALSPFVCSIPDPEGVVDEGGVHHEVLAPKGGKVVYLGRSVKNPLNNTQRLQQGDTIRQWDKTTGKDTLLWDSFDFLDAINERTASSNGDGAEFWPGCDGAVKSEDWTHANSIQVGPSGNIIMSIRHLNQVIAIAPDFKSIKWRLGGPGGQFTFNDPKDQFYHQHTASELPNGNILVFDNGNGRPAGQGGQYSRALELKLDHVNKKATKVWEYRHKPDLYALCCSSATRISNGNTVVVFGGDFDRLVCCRVYSLVEVDSKGNTVAEMTISAPGKFIQYRAYPIKSLFGESER